MQHLARPLDTAAFLDAVRSVLPAQDKPYQLHEPCFSGNEWKYAKECLDTGWVSSVGKFVDDFEKRLADYTGVRRAVVTVNGTAALHLALKMTGVEPGDEVLVPALTFVAPANAVSYCGAVPHFVDSESKTLGVDPAKLKEYMDASFAMKNGVCFNRKTSRRVKALVVMHVFGHPVRLEETAAVCREFGIDLIEDAAEALGSFYRGKHVGHWGKFTALSFNGNKIVTTGGGGAILTGDEAVGAAIKHIVTTAKLPHAWEFNHNRIGYNYRMPNINAALGVAQLEELPCFLEKKRLLASRYKKAFAAVPGAHFVDEPDGALSNFWLNAVLLDDVRKNERDALLAALHQSGVKARPVWTLMHKLPMFQACPRMNLDAAENLEARLVNLPSSAFL